jgi:hypothetical protein
MVVSRPTCRASSTSRDATQELAVRKKNENSGARLKQILEQTYLTGLRESFELCKHFQPPLSEFLSKHPVVAATAELETWIHPEKFTKDGRLSRAVRVLSFSRKEGLHHEVTRLFCKAIVGRKGAPVRPETRTLAVAALDAKLTDPKFSWQSFANLHCPCGKKRHDIDCKERIRQSAMELQRLLRKFGVKQV